MNYSDMNKKEKVVLKIQNVWRKKKMKFDDINNYSSNIYKYIFDMMTSYHLNYTRGYILQEEYNKNMEILEKIKDDYSTIYNSLFSLKVVNVFDYYDKMMSDLESILYKILEIQKSVGTLSIYTIIKNELNIDKINIPDNINKRLLEFYNTVYNCISYNIYSIDDEYNIQNNTKALVKYSIFNEKENSEESKVFDHNIIKNINECNNDIICKSEESINLPSLTEKISGGKIFITFPNNKIIVLKGIFSEDPLNMASIGGTLSKKFNDIKTSLEMTPISSESFKKTFLIQISLRDLVCLSEIEIVNNCIKQYNDLKRLKGKTIASLVKEFLSSDHFKQRDMLSLFLMCEEDKETQYLAYLMYDMISCESYLMKPQLCSENVYVSLHWSLKKIFKCAITNINNYQQNIDPNIDIPYEKKIMLLKCSENVKTKAMEKLKEIQSKNGENCVKAQQYLDGLLRIPFQIFIREPILSFLQDFKLRIIAEINYISSIKENINGINEIKQECNLIKDKELTSYDISNYLNNVEKIIIENTSGSKLKINTNFINSQFLSGFNTKSSCYNFIKSIKELLSDNDLKSLDDKELGFIFKSKIKSSKYSLNEIKDYIHNFFELEIIHLDSNSITKVLEHFQIPLEKNIVQPLIMTIKEKQHFLRKEWELHINNKKQYLSDVRSCLDNAVYGHDEAKISISRVIAQWANGEQRGYCFGFQGAPGCGKTSLAKQGLTKCLKDENGNPRPFAFIPLGGSCNGSTLEGHSYTYVGSTWGRVVDILMECKCMNPIIFIDELDKVSESVHGKEITGILTHLTDASQNEGFSDKYFSGIDIDLSKCLIIFSYNDVSKVDKILLDRIHEINFKSITLQEKLIIAKKYMIPELCKAVGFRDEVIISDDIIQYIIETYTLEAGCRKLKEKLMEILRDINLRSQIGDKIDGKEIVFPFEVTKEFLTNDLFIDKPKITIKKILPNPRCGLVNGLYATTSGMGGITIIECFKIPSESKMRLELTGQQGDVMKESMSVAKTVAYNILPLEVKKKIHKEWKDDGPFGFHIHCPEGATPKDGPSAGAAITSCIYSVMTGIPVRNNIGITGEIDLNGRIHAIGGLSSKVQGAKSAGCNMVLCPTENKTDVEKILRDEYSPCDDNFQIKMVSDIWEVISILLVENELKPLDYTGPQLDYHKVDDTLEAEEKKLLLNSPKSKFKII
jgi:hypothetical protein